MPNKPFSHLASSGRWKSAQATKERAEESVSKAKEAIEVGKEKRCIKPSGGALGAGQGRR